MNSPTASNDGRPSAARANLRVAFVLAGVALAFFCAVIVNHLPA